MNSTFVDEQYAFELKAVSKNGMALRLIENPSKEMYIAGVTAAPDVIEYIHVTVNFIQSYVIWQ